MTIDTTIREQVRLTVTGAFTLCRLRLNRAPLIAHRLHKHLEQENIRLLTRYRDLTRVLGQLLFQQAELMEEQRRLIKEQRKLLQLLLAKTK